MIYLQVRQKVWHTNISHFYTFVSYFSFWLPSPKRRRFQNQNYLKIIIITYRKITNISLVLKKSDLINI